MTVWTKESCCHKPDEIQQIAPGLLIQRRDIEQITHEGIDDEPGYTEWVCMSREITVSEYQMLQSITEIDTSRAIDEYTMQLIEEGVL